MRPTPVLLTDAEVAVASALAELAIARGGVLDEFQTPVYLRGLADLDAAIVAQACQEFEREPRGDFGLIIPEVGAIRERVVAIIRRQSVQATRLLSARSDERTYRCHQCQDDPSGWIVPMRCPDVACERRQEHAAHFFTARCPCWLRRNADALRYRQQMALQKNLAIPDDCDALSALEAGQYRWARAVEVWA